MAAAEVTAAVVAAVAANVEKANLQIRLIGMGAIPKRGSVIGAG